MEEKDLYTELQDKTRQLDIAIKQLRKSATDYAEADRNYYLIKTEQVIKLKSLEAFSSAADGKATKIIIPSEIQSLAGLATSFKEVMTDPKREQPEK